MSRRGKQLIPQLNLGKIPSGYVSSIAPVPYAELQDFVENDINYGPQIVSLPVPPYRHAFLVDVQPDKIMISDWEIRTLDKKDKNMWKQYDDMMLLLKQKYKCDIMYYPIDKKLHKLAKIHNDTHGGGGCSYYIFSWTKTREEYSDYQI